MTSLQFLLPASPACPPLSCGMGNPAFVALKPGSITKSADGSGFLLAEITATEQLSLTQWRYTVEIEDAEITTGQTVTADDVTGQLSCLSGTDSALLAKLSLMTPQVFQPLNWQTFALFAPAQAVLTSTPYLLRRHSAFQLHAIEAAIHGGTGPVSLTLERTAANGVSYITPLHSPLTLNGAGLYTARLTLPAPLTIPAFCAVRASISAAADIYTTTAQGLELHLITSEP